MSPSKKLLAIAVASLSALSGFAQGTVAVFDNFLPGEAAYLDNFWMQPYPGAPSIGFPFQPTQAGWFHSTELPLRCAVLPNAADISLCPTDPVTGFPAPPIDLFTPRGDLPTTRDATRPPLIFTSSTRPYLEAGQTYWLILTAPSGAYVEWNISAIVRPTPGYIQIGGVGQMLPYEYIGAFRINVTPVPEPATTSLLLFLSIFVLLRRSRSAQRSPS